MWFSFRKWQSWWLILHGLVLENDKVGVINRGLFLENEKLVWLIPNGLVLENVNVVLMVFLEHENVDVINARGLF